MTNSPSTQPVAESPKSWMPRIGGIIAAGILAGTFAFAVKVNKAPVQPMPTSVQLNMACGNAQPAKYIDNAGIDSTRAMGIIITHPSRLNEVCDIVSRAMSDTLLEQPRAKTSKSSAQTKSNNVELHALADSLGINHALATKVVEQSKSRAAAQSSAPTAAPAMAPAAMPGALPGAVFYVPQQHAPAAAPHMAPSVPPARGAMEAPSMAPPAGPSM